MYFRFVLMLTLALAISPVPAEAADGSPALGLSQTRLGPLVLGKNAKVSDERLKKLFPACTIQYEMGQGDSPDLHYFEVLDMHGELLFAISSFIDDDAGESKKTASEVPIHLLQVYSTQITGTYGLRIGDRV